MSDAYSPQYSAPGLDNSKNESHVNPRKKISGLKKIVLTTSIITGTLFAGVAGYICYAGYKVATSGPAPKIDVRSVLPLMPVSDK